MSIRAITRAIVFVTCACATGVAVTACELLVQLDRSAVDAGEAGCSICSDVTEPDDAGGKDGRADGPDAEAGPLRDGAAAD
jgi:hypothetical protein